MNVLARYNDKGKVTDPHSAGYKNDTAYKQDMLASLFSQGLREDERAKRDRQFHIAADNNEKGVAYIKLMSDRTQAIPNAAIVWGGREYVTGADGILKVVQSEYLDERVSAEKKKREDIERLMELLSYGGDEVFSDLFDKNHLVQYLSANHPTKQWPNSKLYVMNEDGDLAIAAAQAGTSVANVMLIDEDLQKVDARPSTLRSYSRTGDKLGMALQKLSMYLACHAPAITTGGSLPSTSAHSQPVDPHSAKRPTSMTE